MYLNSSLACGIQYGCPPISTTQMKNVFQKPTADLTPFFLSLDQRLIVFDTFYLLYIWHNQRGSPAPRFLRCPCACESSSSSEFEAYSIENLEAKSLALAAQVAGLHQHTCYAARYLGSGNIFCIKFQWLAEDYWKNANICGLSAECFCWNWACCHQCSAKPSFRYYNWSKWAVRTLRETKLALDVGEFVPTEQPVSSTKSRTI